MRSTRPELVLTQIVWKLEGLWEVQEVVDIEGECLTQRSMIA